MEKATQNVAEKNQLQKCETFKRLRDPSNPLVLYNIWDAGSAMVVAKSEAKAIATSSWAVAHGHGFDDGEKIPLELVMHNLRRIVDAVDLPVTVDLESGYGERPEAVEKCFSLAIEAGGVGCNFEDSVPGTGVIRETAIQAGRISAGRKAAEAMGVPFFINARCDLFFQGDAVPHDQKLLAKAIDRVRAYAEAGADGFFVPGLADVSLIHELADKSPIPLNILAGSKTSLQSLVGSGVSRVSYGGAPYAELLAVLERAALSIRN